MIGRNFTYHSGYLGHVLRMDTAVTKPDLVWYKSIRWHIVVGRGYGVRGTELLDHDRIVSLPIFTHSTSRWYGNNTIHASVTVDKCLNTTDNVNYSVTLKQAWNICNGTPWHACQAEMCFNWKCAQWISYPQWEKQNRQCFMTLDFCTTHPQSCSNHSSLCHFALSLKCSRTTSAISWAGGFMMDLHRTCSAGLIKACCDVLHE